MRTSRSGPSSPLDSGTVCLQTWIEGKKYFDRSLNAERTARLEKEREDLLAKAKKMAKLSGGGDGGSGAEEEGTAHSSAVAWSMNLMAATGVAWTRNNASMRKHPASTSSPSPWLASALLLMAGCVSWLAPLSAPGGVASAQRGHRAYHFGRDALRRGRCSSRMGRSPLSGRPFQPAARRPLISPASISIRASLR